MYKVPRTLHTFPRMIQGSHNENQSRDQDQLQKLLDRVHGIPSTLYKTIL